jgi:hypothetical protein
MKKAIELNKTYKIEEFSLEWLKILTYPFSITHVPTEFVINTPGFYSPIQSRIYVTNLYVHPDGRVVDFAGTGHFPSVFLCEVWENWACDGHTRMEIVGWRFEVK